METVISTRRLRVIYRPGGIEALRGVDVDIPGYTTTCIIGPNASGKTTLLKAITGIIDYDGVVLVEGRDVRVWRSGLRKILAYTSSLSTSDLLGVRVLDVLLSSRYPLSRGLTDTDEDYRVIYEQAKTLNITHLLDRKIGELSSGELQRVILASALVRSPRILLLDEPDSHLDVASKPWLSMFLKELSSKCTVVLSTHDLFFAFSTCRFFVVLSNGRLVYSGWVRDLVEHSELLEGAYGILFTRIGINGEQYLLPVYRP